MANGDEISPNEAVDLNVLRILATSVNSILIVTGIVATVGVLSLIAFGFQARMTLPDGSSYFAMEPFWVLQHLVRGLGFLAVSWQLWRFTQAIKRYCDNGNAGFNEFVLFHTTAWRWAARVLIIVGVCMFLWMFRQLNH